MPSQIPIFIAVFCVTLVLSQKVEHLTGWIHNTWCAEYHFEYRFKYGLSQ